MPVHLIDPPTMAATLHPRLSRHAASPPAARVALLNYVAERAVLFEPMSPEELLICACAPPHPRLVLATDPARQRAYLQLFLGAVTISDQHVEDPTEALQIVMCLRWLMRLVDQAIR